LKLVKRGGWTLEQVKAEAGRLFVLIEEAKLRSRLPPDPDETGANQLLLELHRGMLAV
jgi:hypothetical protein